MARKTSKKPKKPKVPENRSISGLSGLVERKAAKTAIRGALARHRANRSEITTGELQHEFHEAIRRNTPFEKHLTFPIVGIGSSAGGVEALSLFFRSVRPDIGMAFVVIQHMAADQESMLPEILGRATSMPVTRADHLVGVEPNHVYVIPPNRSLGIVHGVLRLMPRVEPRSQHMPIDFFFRCLSEDQKSNAIGILLSGGDGDGAMGLIEVKASGGITFAQDPQTARVPNMPREAIIAGGVDFVLPIPEIAEELRQIVAHPFLSSGPSEKEILPEGEGELDTLFRILRNRMGVDFSLYKKPTFLRRLKRRMVIQRVDTLHEYLQCLQRQPEEIDALFGDLLINVTSFFRDAAVFEELKSKILPKLLRNHSPGMPFRIWVAGCATGEEAYSLAICILEVMDELGLRFALQVFATDLSEAAIQKARAGIYSADLCTDVSPELLRKYFVKIDSSYQVSRVLRDACVFARHDVTRDPPFSRLNLVSCRNLLIYLGHSLQQRVTQLFGYSLEPGGCLMLGPSETAAASTDLFMLADKKHKFFIRKPTLVRNLLEFDSRPISLSPQPAVVPEIKVDSRSVAEEIRAEVYQAILNKYKSSCVVVDDAYKVLHFIGKSGEFLEHGTGDANLDLLKLARNGLQLKLRTLLQKAKTSQRPVAASGITYYNDGERREVDLEIHQILARNSVRCYLVFFDQKPEIPGKLKKIKGKRDSHAKRGNDLKMLRLQDELAATTEYLKSSLRELETSNEDLQSANEEILSANEELQSTNEEMETAKEELQSSNEELTTVNEELATRNHQLSAVNDYLKNLLASVNIPIVMVDSSLKVRRFTSQCEKLLNLIASDVGRPITDIKPNFDLPGFREMILDTIENSIPREAEVRDHEGQLYSLRIRPFRTSDNKIDGAVLTFIEPTTKKT
jgi:two-component system CheB/CheR fusion protein